MNKNYDNIEEVQSWFEQVANIIAGAMASGNRHFVALAAKWAKEDLVPGLSDMDFRIVADEQTTVEDWIELDRTMGQTHLEMVQAHPEWNRINEHTAGTAMSISELMDDRFYNPEYPIWETWYGQRDWLVKLKAKVLHKSFGYSDEHYHMSRFVNYFSRYDHGIDPAINVGYFEPKYPLHSRCWHYFAPPMTSAACILAGRNFEGKKEALRWLCANTCIKKQTEAVLEQVEKHYETGELSDSARLAQFEEFLYTGFCDIYPVLCESIQLLKVDFSRPITEVKKQLAANKPSPIESLMENLRWARTRTGRYYFYVNAPTHFDTEHLLEAEMNWLRMLTKPFFSNVGRAIGDGTLDAGQCLRKLGISVSRLEQDAMDYLFEMAQKKGDHHQLTEAYRGAVEKFPIYYRMLEKTVAKLAR